MKLRFLKSWKFRSKFDNEDGERSRKEEVYKVDKFAMKERFLEDIAADIALFEEIEKEINELGLLKKIPKPTA